MQEYADDTILVVSGKQRRELESRAELALAVVCAWADSAKVRLSQCSYMLFPNGRISMARRLPTIRLASTILTRVKEMKLLGVIIDPWFTCMPQVNYLKSKLDITVPKLFTFIHMQYHLPPTSLKQLYTQIVQPVIT